MYTFQMSNADHTIREITELKHIDMTCVETYPCIHYVVYTTDDGKRHESELDGVEIYVLLQELNFPNHLQSHFKHFEEYKEDAKYRKTLVEHVV